MNAHPNRCPICGGTNDCAVMQGRGNWWGFTRAIPDHMLERTPPEARDRACVCKACAFGNREPIRMYQRMAEILAAATGSPGPLHERRY